jgi:RNA polymerase sigma factor (sigma-70 family)
LRATSSRAIVAGRIASFERRGPFPPAACWSTGTDLTRLHERLDAEAEARRLYGAMERLPEGERAVLELVALDGLGAAETGQALGISQVAARVRLHRARRLLRRELRSSARELNERASEAS